MTTTKIETLTDVERHQLPLYTPYLGSKAIRIIDAHAAERAALTEQVAQLTREMGEARATLERIAQQAPLQFDSLESEVARLTAELERLYHRSLDERDAELAALRERVARAEAILLGPGDNWCQSALRALEVLRGE